jgi:hypothetical protein
MILCINCGGDLRRVGLFNCDTGHPPPTLAQRIARAIENDLNDRRGLHLSSLADERRNDIVDTWEALIEAELTSKEKPIDP